jgi:hypothetical protein
LVEPQNRPETKEHHRTLNLPLLEINYLKTFESIIE